jgi:hypothetical protein
MAAPKKIIYVDTNVIIEATRTGCLKAIVNHYDVRTVEEVRKESLKVPQNKSSYVKVEETLFGSQVDVSPVGAADILRAAAKAPGLTTLDKGERDLLAHVAGLNNPGVWVITTADKAAVKGACALGLGNRMISLEELASACGQKPKLNEWFTKAWLKTVKTECLFEGL